MAAREKKRKRQQEDDGEDDSDSDSTAAGSPRNVDGSTNRNVNSHEPTNLETMLLGRANLRAVSKDAEGEAETPFTSLQGSEE